MYIYTWVYAHIDLSGKKPYKQVDMDRVVVSGSVVVCVLVLAWRECEFKSCSKHNRCNFYNPYNTYFRDQDPIQTMRCMVVEPTPCIYIYVHCLWPDGVARWVEHLSPVLEDQGIWTSRVWIRTLRVWTMVESNHWLKNWYLLLPSMALAIIRIGQGLVGSVSG